MSRQKKKKKKQGSVLAYHNTMANEETKQQIRIFIENAIRKAKNPDPREKLKRERKKRALQVAKQYGL